MVSSVLATKEERYLKFLKHLIRSAMQARAPAWCEIDRKRLLRHTAYCFLLLSPVRIPQRAAQCHLSTLPRCLPPLSYRGVLHPRRIPISHIILFPANPVLHLPSPPEPAFLYQTDYYARIVGTLWAPMLTRDVARSCDRTLIIFSRVPYINQMNWHVKYHRCAAKYTAKAIVDKYRSASLWKAVLC